jgi:Est1 DNA/RNA binding domain/Protein kinase domain
VLQSLFGGVGIPPVHWFGTIGENNVMVTDPLGSSLEDEFNSRDRKFSSKTVSLIADQLLSRVEFVHRMSYVHCDIKPNNFRIGIGEKYQLNIVGFGRAMQYRDLEDNTHLLHGDCERSCRVELRIMGYMLLYFAHGSQKKFDLFMDENKATPIEVLCRESEVFTKYFKYIASLDFDQQPDYSCLRRLFRDTLGQHDYILDWKTEEQPEEDKLVNKAKAIYACLIEEETKCIESIQRQTKSTEKLDSLQWQTFIAPFRTLLDHYSDYFRTLYGAAAGKPLRDSSEALDMLGRMWSNGIQSLLDLLVSKAEKAKESQLLDHIISFFHKAYKTISLLYESVPDFRESWMESLGDVTRYPMAMTTDMRVRKIYIKLTRYWYTKAANLSPNDGRLQHHLGVIARPDRLKQLFYYTKSTISVKPFTYSHKTLLLLFDPARATTMYPQILTLFVDMHGALFTRQTDISTFRTPAEQFLDQLDEHAGTLSLEQGVYIAGSNCGAILDFGHVDAALPSMFARLSQRSKAEILDNASRYWKENSTCVQTGIAERSNGNQTISDSIQVTSLASEFAFTTMDIILGRIDENMLPYMHVSLAFLYCAAMVPKSMTYIQADVPWARLAEFLNTLIGSETDMSEHMKEFEFPAPKPGVQLPEDFSLRGFDWCELYYPAGFFSDIAEDDDKRRIEPPSATDQRKERCLRLGICLAKVWFLIFSHIALS